MVVRFDKHPISNIVLVVEACSLSTTINAHKKLADTDLHRNHSPIVCGAVRLP